MCSEGHTGTVGEVMDLSSWSWVDKEIDISVFETIGIIPRPPMPKVEALLHKARQAFVPRNFRPMIRRGI